MTVIGWFQIFLFIGLVLIFTKPFGTFMYKVFNGEKTWLTPIFSGVTLVVTYFILRFQNHLPMNPMHFGDTQKAPPWATAMTPDLAFGTAASFTTNTNWQAYDGENTMSYFSQMVGLASHNFFSAATGIVIAIALVRGLGRKSAQTIGNFWVDLTRCTLYVLMPLCIVLALVY